MRKCIISNVVTALVAFPAGTAFGVWISPYFAG